MQRSDLLADMEFRFTEPEDVEKYGGDWFTYSEIEIATLPARRQVELEVTIDSPLAAVMDGVRMSSSFGDLAGAWLAMTMAGREVAWATFNPKIMLAEWRVKPAGKAPEVDPAPSVVATSPTPEHAGPRTDTVTLSAMPISG